MDPKDLNPISLSFLGDAIYSLKIREYYIRCGYRQGNVLQQLSKRYVSAEGQKKVYERLQKNGFLTEKENEVFKSGRNHITHIPKNVSRLSYEIATGLEALCGYLYLFDKDRCEELFTEILKGGEENE
ncbi:MAG: ribonuclease III [Erysipelotrichaceae bacterium]|nr:ribonuclease III [Erysipelotrichaceae bacterium]MBQ5756110.1 ribonuclease III [Erysipelotrichaceae bacterium]